MRVLGRTVVLIAALAMPAHAFAWSLKTHVWISQAILNDAADDGMLELLGKNYPLPPETLEALTSSPSAFRMGNIGPDAIPDPIVGQTTTHPGVENGWQTDDWLNHLLQNSKTPEELAMALGFISHAASDIFAHTYVNAYAGDIFSLTDNEVDVERRHFVLEKYVESKTPVPVTNDGAILNWGDGLATPAAGMRDLLIYDDQASLQNLAAGTGVHLVVMAKVRDAVSGVRSITQGVIEQITEWAADYYKLQADLLLELEPVNASLEAAKLNLSAQRDLLAVEEAAHQAALDVLAEANRIIQDHPELISGQQNLLAEQTKLATDAVLTLARVTKEVDELVGNLNSSISSLRKGITDLACNLLVIPREVKRCKEKANRLNDQIAGLQQQITGAKQRKQAAEAAVQAAEAVRDETTRLIDRLNRELNRATQNLANGAYQAAVDVSKAKLDAQRVVLDEAERVLSEIQKKHDELTAELDVVNKIIDDVKELLDKHNAITFLVDNWVKGIDKGTEEYIKTSHMVGRDMLTNSGDPLDRYFDWFDCYSYVFVGIPVQLGELKCETTKLLEELNAKFDELVEELPEILQWALFPMNKAKAEALEELEPVLAEARRELITFITNKQTADFIDLVSNPENATRAKLNEVFSQDGSGKNLVVFDTVADIVDADLKISNGVLDPNKFAPLKGAVTLAKLSLLGPEQLNQLVRDQVGNDYVSIYGPNLYPEDPGRFSALVRAIRNIDGNHQWQAYGLPRPKRLGIAHANPAIGQFGYDFSKENEAGFRLWVDPYIREKVFLKLFPSPVMGAFSSRPETQWDHYRFPECVANPYPRTQDLTGGILASDARCAETNNPDQPSIMTQITTKDEYRERFYRCESSGSGRYWAMAGAYRTERGAQKFGRLVEARYPDLITQIWKQPRRALQGRLWVVMLAACTDEDHARAAVEMAKSRGIALDAYVWRDELPFERVE